MRAKIAVTEYSSTKKTEFSIAQQKRKKSKSRKSTIKKKVSTSCTYNGHRLTVGPRGGCSYYLGHSKEYVDRS